LSSLSDCAFTNESTLQDWSSQELRIRRSIFSDSSAPTIEKTDGTLSLQCCDFNSSGPIIINYARLDISSLLSGGTNTFRNVSDCIQFNEVTGLFLEEGGNDFSGCSHTIFEGTYDTTCVQNSCQFQLGATHNHWGYGNAGLSNAQGLVLPSSSLIRVYASGTSVCSGYESGNSCDLILVDPEPIDPIDCLPMGKRMVAQRNGVDQHWYDVLNGIQPSMESCTIRCYDASGRMVMHTQLAQGDFFRIDELETTSGLYLLEVIGASDRITLRRIME
jgi:hypothetical protein